MESQIQSFILTQFQLERLASLARDSLPNESCALLLGNNTNKENEIQVIETLSMKNSDALPTTRFRIDSQELINGYLRAEKMGLNVVGIFHSHPAPPIPSTDKIFMEINPVVWLIYSTLTNESRAYIYEQKKVREVRLRVIKE
jgi:proteasome lid subunit RPN8/RPN11